jgi:hypothetical protein
MAISINWLTKVISIPKADLTLVSGTFYTFDTDQFRLDLRAIEKTVEGIDNLITHKHNTESIIAGTTYARGLRIINGYTLTFEDGAHSVQLEGSNNNFWDIGGGILNQNQVQVIPTNTAGLIVVTSGSGVTEQDKIDIANKVWINALRSLTSGTKDTEIDEIQARVNALPTLDNMWRYER